jgi:nucleotide-binding universal stress UspA family protein
MSNPVILVPLDGSELALSTLPVAKVLCAIEQTSLRMLHVGEERPSDEEPRSRLGREARQISGSTFDIRSGSPAAEILQVSKETKPRLIVMCRHSSAMKVLQDAPCPVVLVPPERGATPWHLHHILVPHDGTPTTSAALQPAAQLADQAGAELVVAHVTDVALAPAELGSLTAPRYVDQPQHEWPAWTSEFAKRLACVCSLGHLHVRILLAHGNPAAEILNLSAKLTTDLIVVAWRGRWEAPRATTFKDLLRQAHCPIMVLRANAPDSDA